jgi:allophanate hydrolase subunit 2
MAYRLEGPRVAHRSGADIISEPVMPGSVQVPLEGHPIVLMMDGQVTGGYSKIANAITADMCLLAQAMPGEYLQFYAVDLEGAYERLRERERILAWLRTKFHLRAS